MKKSKLLLLAASLAAGLNATAYDFAVDGVYYSITDSEALTVSTTYASTSYNSYADSVITLPAAVVYNDITYSVTSIGASTFRKCTSLKQVSLPATITSISDNAFYQCTALETVGLPSTITTMGGYAFYQCYALSAITLPDSLTSVGNYAFYQDTSIVALNFPTSLTTAGNYAFNGLTKLTSVTLDNFTSLGNYAFGNCTSLTSVTIPSTITTFGTYMFQGCSGLISVTMPDTWESVPQGLLRNCTGLTSLTVPSAVTTLGNYCFDGCTGLNETNISLPTGLTKIGNYSLSNCGFTTAPSIENVTSIGSYAFRGNPLKEFTIPASVTTIESYCFSYCDSLTYLNIPKTVASIAIGLVGYDTGLKTLVIEDGTSITSIPNLVCTGCSSLDSVYLPEGILTIGSSAFLNCSALKAFSVPSTVTTINGAAFQGCTSMETMTSLATTPPTVSQSTTFADIVTQCTLYVLQGYRATYLAATNWSSFSKIREIGVEVTGSNYNISTVSEWNEYAANYTNFTDLDTITVTADLDFSSTTITPFTQLFCPFYGGGHKITVNYTTTDTYQGALFHTVTSDASIQDFTIAGSFTTAKQHCGVVAGYMYGTANDVVSEVSVTATNTYVGGMFSQTSDASLVNCGFTGTITATINYVGGLIAYSCAETTLTGCYNTGTVTGGAYVGGLAAYAPSGANPKFTNCYNTGTVTGSGSTGYTGGLIGYVVAAATAVFDNCYNTGTVTGAGSYVGGIVAYQGSSTSGSLTCSNCYNTGTISSTGSKGNCIAGIVGYSRVNTILTDCYNAGTISGAYYLGGIYSTAYSNGSTLTNCFNTGDITGTSTSYGYVGGILGQSNKTTISNCYNTGNISGLKQVGGIIGDVHTSQTLTVSGAYSTGTVTSTTTGYSGTLFGCSAALSTISGNSYSNCYALSSVVADTDIDTTYFAAKTYAELASLDMGDGWTAGDNYTYPRLTTLADNDYAKAHAAAVIPAVETDTYSAMTGVFYLGAPDNVTWAADNSVISYDGQMGYFNADYAGGTITMTATSGDVTATTELVYGVTTGVESVLSDSGLTEAEIVSETLYNTSGQIVTAPADGQKAIYIVRRVYSDGTTETAKEVR